MSSYYANKKIYQQPLCYVNTKSAWPAKNAYDYSATSRKQYENPRGMRDKIHRNKINYDNYPEYENGYDYINYKCECYYHNQYDKGYMGYNYSTEKNTFQRAPQKYDSFETETMYGEDSDSDYPQRVIPRGRRELSYNYQDPRWRHFSKAQRKDRMRHYTGSSDTDRGYYQRNSNLYPAHQPRAFHTYTYTQQHSRAFEDSDDETSTNYTGATTASNLTKPQVEHQVYMSHQMSDKTAFSREKILSVIDYNEKASSLKQKRENNGNIKGKDSEVVYIPMIVPEEVNSTNKNSSSTLILKNPEEQLKNNDKLNSTHKISTSKIILETPKEEEQLKGNAEIFVAGHLEHKNIFRQSHNTPTEKLKRQSHSAERKKSNISTDPKQISGNKSKLHENVSDYPVKKSYIKVAPINRMSHFISPTSKDSKSINKTPSEVAVDQKTIFADKNKTPSMDRENSKNEPVEMKKQPCKIIYDRKCAIRTVQQRSNVVENVGKSNNKDFFRISSINNDDQKHYDDNINKDLRKRCTHVKKNVSSEKSTALDVEHPRKSATSIKSEICAIKQISTTEGLEKKNSTSISSKIEDVHRPASHNRYLLDFGISSKEHSEFPNKTKSITRIKRNKRSKLSNVPESTESMDSYHTSQITPRRSEPENFSEIPETGNNPATFLGVDTHYLAHCIFRAAQFFLGITTHDMLMEVADQYYKN